MIFEDAFSGNAYGSVLEEEASSHRVKRIHTSISGRISGETALVAACAAAITDQHCCQVTYGSYNSCGMVCDENCGIVERFYSVATPHRIFAQGTAHAAGPIEFPSRVACTMQPYVRP